MTTNNVTPINALAEMAAGAQERENNEYTRTMDYFKARYGTYNGDVVDLSTGQVLQLNRAAKEWGAEANFEHQDRTVNPINELFSHADRIKITRFYMDPANSTFGYTDGGRFNTFTGWWREPISCESDDSHVGLWLEFVSEVLRGIDGAEEFFHNWVAQIVQKPWEKNYTVITLAGKTEGTGKSLLAKSVAEMLGTSLTNEALLKPAPALTTSGDKIFSNFNKLLEGKVLVVADELGSNKAHHSAIMKDLVTSYSLTVEAKFKDSYTQSNYLNFILTTNKTTATLVDEHSRRDVIFSIQQQDVRLIRRLSAVLVAWQYDSGFEKMLDWYMKRDISSFDARARAPKFIGWEDSIVASKSNSTMVQDALVNAIKEFDKPIALSRASVKLACEALGYDDDFQVLRTMSERKEVFVRRKTIRFNAGKNGEDCCIFIREVSTDELRVNTRAFFEFISSSGGVF